MNLAINASADHYFDPKFNATVMTVLPGFHKVNDEAGVALTTLLGSCVAACIWDRETGIGGLNHFLLPEDDRTAKSGFSARYGVYAMELLINEILKLGGSKSRLEAKAFGGGNVINASTTDTIGSRNAKFVTSYLETEGIPLVASDMGGDRARRIYFFTNSGKVDVQRLAPSENSGMRRAEAELKTTILAKPKAGGVELF